MAEEDISLNVHSITMTVFNSNSLFSLSKAFLELLKQFEDGISSLEAAIVLARSIVLEIGDLSVLDFAKDTHLGIFLLEFLPSDTFISEQVQAAFGGEDPKLLTAAWTLGSLRHRFQHLSSVSVAL